MAQRARSCALVMQSGEQRASEGVGVKQRAWGAFVPDQLSHRQHTATTWHPWPSAVGHWQRSVHGHQSSTGCLIARLEGDFALNPRRIGARCLKKLCRATCKLQLCLNDLGLILASFQIVKHQSIAHETVNHNQHLAKFLS